MTKFKEIFFAKSFNKQLHTPSCEVSSSNSEKTLSIRFDSKDIIVEIGYEGKPDPWFEGMCFLLIEKSLQEAEVFNFEQFKLAFKEDPFFWDCFEEESELIFSLSLELLHAALDVFRGREFYYKDRSPLICRCFGVREADILEFLKVETDPTLENLMSQTKAGMGCRSCVPQLKRVFEKDSANKGSRFFKNRPLADWILIIDNTLKTFDASHDWQMEVESFKGKAVIIKYIREGTTQLEEEEMMKKLQGFLGAEVDPELGFFLKRTRHL